MRDPKRIDRILGLIRTYWYGRPDYRLGQLIVNLNRDVHGTDDPFYLEDDVLEAQLQAELKTGVK